MNLTIHDMPDEDIRSGKYYDAWHWLWSKQREIDNTCQNPKNQK